MVMRNYLALLASSVALLAAGVARGNQNLCEIAKKPAGLSEYLVYRDSDEEGNIVIHAEFDGDGKEDTLIWSPQSSSSSMPSDLATARLLLSSTEKPHDLEEVYVNILKYQRHYYAETASPDHEGRRSTVTLYGIGPRGFRRICTFEKKWSK